MLKKSLKEKTPIRVFDQQKARFFGQFVSSFSSTAEAGVKTAFLVFSWNWKIFVLLFQLELELKEFPCFFMFADFFCRWNSIRQLSERLGSPCLVSLFRCGLSSDFFSWSWLGISIGWNPHFGPNNLALLDWPWALEQTMRMEYQAQIWLPSKMFRPIPVTDKSKKKKNWTFFSGSLASLGGSFLTVRRKLGILWPKFQKNHLHLIMCIDGWVQPKLVGSEWASS